MPNDAIFDPIPPPHALREQPTPAVQQPSAADLSAQLARGIQQAMAPLAAEVADLRQHLQSRPSPSAPSTPTPSPAGGEGGFLEQFVAQPEATLRGAVDQIVSPVLAPALGVLTEAEATRQQQRVVARYGEKGWREVVEPRLRERQAQLVRENPTTAANPQVLRHLVSSILGEDDVADALEAHRQETARMAADAARNRERPPSFVGTPGRSYQREEGDELSAADLETVAKIRSVDPRFDLKAARAAQRQYGSVEERYEAEQAALRQARGAR